MYLTSSCFIVFSTPSPTKAAKSRSTAKQDSFIKKLHTARNSSNSCDICNTFAPGGLEAAHIIDIGWADKLRAEYLQNRALPLSVNDAPNGLLLCASCHTYFDKKPPQITIEDDGKLLMSGDACLNTSLSQFHNQKVSWWESINQDRNYPSSAVLKLRRQWKVPDNKKRKRDQQQQEEEEEEEGAAW